MDGGELAGGQAAQAAEKIEEKYRGIRPAPGYPVCPDHTEKRYPLGVALSWRSGPAVQLTESCAMWPGSSVSGFYFNHPQSRYFGLGKIDRDQAQEYSERTGMSVAEVERWLGPSLNYEPIADLRLAVPQASRLPPSTRFARGS